MVEISKKLRWLNMRVSHLSAVTNMAFISAIHYLCFLLTKPSYLNTFKYYEVFLAFLFSLFSFTLIFFFLYIIFKILLKIKKSSMPWVRADQILIKVGFICFLTFFLNDIANTVFSFSLIANDKYLTITRVFIFIFLVIAIFFDKKQIKLNFIPSFASNTIFILSVIFGIILTTMIFYEMTSQDKEKMTINTDRYNIIILSTDGLTLAETDLNDEIKNLTPNLKKLSQESVVFKRAFSSGSVTTTSLFSIITGRSPFRSKKLYPPDLFYTHFNSPVYFLKNKFGYRTIIDSVRHYADPFDRNLRGTFSESNGRSQPFLFYLTNPIFMNTTYYLYMNLDYWKSNLNLLLGIERPSFYIVSGNMSGRGFESDSKKIDRILSYLKKEPKIPKFIFTHLLGTHRGKYLNTSNNFPVKKMDINDSFSFFKNHKNALGRVKAIRDFDDLLGQLIRELKVNKFYKDSVIVVTSDHSEYHEARYPLPLLIKSSKFKKRVLHQNFEIKDVLSLILNSLNFPFKSPYNKTISNLSSIDSNDQFIYQINKIGIKANFKTDAFLKGRCLKQKDGNPWS